jgi:putative sterol carrier protein
MSKDRSTTTTPAEIFATLPSQIDCSKTVGIDANFQFELEGPNGGVWVAKLSAGACSVSVGPVEKPNVTIKMTDKDFVALATGQLQAMTAFISGKIRVYGDYNLATRLQALFGV